MRGSIRVSALRANERNQLTEREEPHEANVDDAHDDFGQVLDSDGTVLACFHEWGAHEHPSLTSPDHATPGNGLLLFFRVLPKWVGRRAPMVRA